MKETNVVITPQSPYDNQSAPLTYVVRVQGIEFNIWYPNFEIEVRENEHGGWHWRIVNNSGPNGLKEKRKYNEPWIEGHYAEATRDLAVYVADKCLGHWLREVKAAQEREARRQASRTDIWQKVGYKEEADILKKFEDPFDMRDLP